MLMYISNLLVMASNLRDTSTFHHSTITTQVTHNVVCDVLMCRAVICDVVGGGSFIIIYVEIVFNWVGGHCWQVGGHR